MLVRALYWTVALSFSLALMDGCSLFLDLPPSTMAATDGGALAVDGFADAGAFDAGKIAQDGAVSADATQNACAPVDGGVVRWGLTSNQTTEHPVFTSASVYGSVRPGPSVMQMPNGFRMWWPRSEGNVHLAEATSLEGPWHAPGNPTPNSSSVVLFTKGSGFERVINGVSVIFVRGTYYMYYLAQDSNYAYTIGLATSSDGESWNRVSTGPIVTSVTGRSGLASIGSASAFYLDDGTDAYFYLMFFDANAPGSTLDPNPSYGYDGHYILRSKDPFFASNTRFQLNAAGSWTQGDTRTLAFFDADRYATAAYAPQLGRIAVFTGIRRAIWWNLEKPLEQSNIRTFENETHPGNSGFGMAVVRSPLGHLLLGQDCATLRLDAIYPFGDLNAAKEQDFAHYGVDIKAR
jgi:hypothetical protein